MESGSRAWGFASKDSDYDVRFIYVRRKEDYLQLNEPRDVIEWQLDELLELKKKSDESEKGIQIPVIRDFIADEIARQKNHLDGAADDRKLEWEELNECFRRVLG